MDLNIFNIFQSIVVIIISAQMVPSVTKESLRKLAPVFFQHDPSSLIASFLSGMYWCSSSCSRPQTSHFFFYW